MEFFSLRWQNVYDKLTAGRKAGYLALGRMWGSACVFGTGAGRCGHLGMHAETHTTLNRVTTKRIKKMKGAFLCIFVAIVSSKDTSL